MKTGSDNGYIMPAMAGVNLSRVNVQEERWGTQRLQVDLRLVPCTDMEGVEGRLCMAADCSVVAGREHAHRHCLAFDDHIVQRAQRQVGFRVKSNTKSRMPQ